MSETENNKENNKNEEQKEERDLAERLAECERLRDEYLAGWQRAKADFLNYKRQEEERLAQLVKLANEELMSELLFVLDNFELLKNKTEGEEKERLKPLFLISSQLESILRKYGLEKLKVQPGDQFNPELHEAIESVAEGESGTILEVVANGYTLNGKLIRAAKVKVSK